MFAFSDLFPQVIKALTSLKSRGYVKEQFAWRHYYWYLTNEGIQYLRDYLHLPSEIVPSTLKRALPRGDARPARSAAPRADGGKPEGDRAAYRYLVGILVLVMVMIPMELPFDSL